MSSLAILKKSAGLPRLTTSTPLVAPRSSTQRPQLTQVRSGLSLPVSTVTRPATSLLPTRPRMSVVSQRLPARCSSPDTSYGGVSGRGTANTGARRFKLPEVTR